MEQIIFYIIILILISGYMTDRILEWLNLRHHKTGWCKEMESFTGAEQYARSVEYHRTRYRFELAADTTGLLLIAVVLQFDMLPAVSGFIKNIFPDPVISALMFFAVMGFAYDLAGLPFDVYETFVIEEKYGFNRTSVKTFITDKLKSYALAVLMGGLLLWAFIWFYFFSGKFFWLYLWMVYTGFSILMMMFYTALIVPLFNKLTPLSEGQLRDAITAYCAKNGFNLKNILVMDGSRRSSKANAFFSGLGMRKSIILYDTLIRNHTVNEIVAVLAHEVGHYRKLHTRKMLVLSSIQSIAMMYLLSICIGHPVFTAALGASPDEFYIGLVAFGILFSPVSTVLGTGMNYISRAFEKEADSFAAVTSSADDLGCALKKLSTDQLSNLHPHPAYVFVHYSHPPLTERLRNLRKLSPTNQYQ